MAAGFSTDFTLGHLPRRHPGHGGELASPGLLVPAQRSREITAAAFGPASGNPKVPCTTPSCRAAPDWSPARGWAASCVRHRRATSPRPGAASGESDAENAGTAKPTRSSSVNVASTRSTESDHPAKLDRIMSIGRSGLTKSVDHGKSNHHCRSEPPAGHRPRFPCSPMTCSATSLSATSGRVTSPCQLHQPVGFAGCRTGDISNHRVQTIRADQQIAFGRAAVFELDPHPVVRTDRPRPHGNCIGCDRPESLPADGQAGLDVGPSERARPAGPRSRSRRC